MSERVKLNRVESLFEERLDFPAARDEAAAEFSDVTVLFADGESNLGELISGIDSEQFTGPNDLYSGLNNELPIEAVGEPRQSEGDS